MPRLRTGGAGTSTTLGDVRDGRELGQLGRHDAKVNAIAFSPKDGKLLASGSADGRLTLWEGAQPISFNET